MRNAMAAVAAARAIGVEPSGRVDLELSAMRGQRVELADGAVVVNDCYNANPLSMRAALDDLAPQTPPAAASRCSATCSSSGRRARPCTARSAPTRPRPGSTCS